MDTNIAWTVFVIAVFMTVLGILASRNKMDLERLHTAVRKHRDMRGDDRCYLDDYELYEVLPEGFVRPSYDTKIEIENCKRYIAFRQDPNITYTSPQREIERLQDIIKGLTDRICAQSELLSRRAQKDGTVERTPDSNHKWQ